MLQVIDEGNAIYVTAVSRDESGDLLAPTTLEWKLKCLSNDQDIVGWTSVASPGAEQSIAIAGAYNAIIDDGRAYEDKQVAFRRDSGLSTQHHEVQTYRVRNQSAV